MIKKILKYLGFGLLSVLIFFIGISVITTIFKPDHKEVFEPFIVEAIPRLTRWNIEEYKSLMSTQGFEAASKDQWNKSLKMFAKLGEYQESLEPKLLSSKTLISISKGLTTRAVYLVPIKFDTGVAHVKLSLFYDDGKVEIFGVRYLSDIFIQ